MHVSDAGSDYFTYLAACKDHEMHFLDHGWRFLSDLTDGSRLFANSYDLKDVYKDQGCSRSWPVNSD